MNYPSEPHAQPFENSDGSPSDRPPSAVGGTRHRAGLPHWTKTGTLALVLTLTAFFPAMGAVFVVNTTLDGADGIPGDGICDTSPVPPPSGLCTLRAALDEANALGGADEIRFSVGGGGIQILTVGGPDALEATTPLTIRGETQPGFTGTPLIQLDFNGGGAIPGLFLTGDDITVRSLGIRGFPLDGIGITGNRARVEGCWIGLDETGAAEANLRGLGISGADHEIGGVNGNLISGNFDGGVVLGAGATRVTVSDNFIGTDPSGALAVGNGVIGDGVKVEGDDNTVGGNLISGNDSTGIRLLGDDNLVAGNLIGLAVDGTTPLGNAFAGIWVAEGANDNVIGGTNILTTNIVSSTRANTFDQGGSGIFVTGAARTQILGNQVGTDVSGQLPRGNALHGIHITQGGTTRSLDTQVGVLAAGGGGGNLVSANGIGPDGGHGILAELSDHTVFFNNRIGLDRNGVAALPNVGDGIRLRESSQNLVGGIPLFGSGPNVIAHNGGAGIAVVDSDADPGGQNTIGNSLAANSTWDNGGLAIDLTLGTPILDGVTTNDADDPDFGPNRLQNFPLVTNVTTDGLGTTTLSGTLDSTPMTSFVVTVFDNPSCDPSGHGEARTFLGADGVTTDAQGDATFSVQTTSAVVFPTAIATVDDPDPNLTDSSEVSPCYLGVVADGLLGDFVWFDIDDDGLQGIDEPGASGLTVRLRDAGGGVVATTLTNAEGQYRFTGVASGDYRIEFDIPIHLTFTTPNAGDDDLDSDVVTMNQTELFSYTAGTVDLSRDAGLVDDIFSDGFESGDTSGWDFP